MRSADSNPRAAFDEWRNVVWARIRRVGAVAAGDALRGYLYGVSPLDPIALGAVLALLGVAAVAATLLPLRRAVRTDPAVALRTE